jgi:PKHD-type hydroxylase
MMLFITDLLEAGLVADLWQWLETAAFVDGKATAGADARLVKHNTQVAEADPQLRAMQRKVTDALHRHRLFAMAARPQTIRAPLFSRYEPGMTYGDHVDNAMMGGMRVDVSVTIFLSDPASYEGGDLVIASSAGEQDVKLAAGSAVVYPTTALHRVAPVTAGVRLAAVTWVRSLVRDAGCREILFDLETARHAIRQRSGQTAETDLLAKVQSNLLRHWIED